MKRRMPIISKAVIVAGVFALSYYLVKEVKLLVALAASQEPFTIVLKDSGFIATKNGFVEVGQDKPTWKLVARREDGSRAEVVLTSFSSNNDFTMESRKIFDVSKKNAVVYSVASETKSTARLDNHEIAVMKAKPTDSTCRTNPLLVEQPQDVGRGELLGYAVVKQRLKSSLSVIERHLAPDLDCEVLYSKVTFMDGNGNITDWSVQSAISIEREAPQQWVFADSPDFVEKSPSGLFEAEARRRGINFDLGALPNSMREKLSRQDQAYESRKQR
ncbi:MAG: hypothetical protein NW208_15755 [Bryobacter sp.]|nr:hypothetical protein [Bryobacter sp.]